MAEIAAELAAAAGLDSGARLWRRQNSVRRDLLDRPFSVKPADVLHELGVATTFFTRSPFTDYANRWAQIRYCGTLARAEGRLVLSSDGDRPQDDPIGNLGVGFALGVTGSLLPLALGEGAGSSMRRSGAALGAAGRAGRGPGEQARPGSRISRPFATTCRQHSTRVR